MIWKKADMWHIAHIVFGAGLLYAQVLPTGAMAEETESFTCTLTHEVRRIERVFQPGGVPCSVRYYINNEPPKTVWRARKSGSFCVDSARKMIQDFQAAGFSCTGMPSGTAIPVPAPQSGRTSPAEPLAGAGESRPAQSLCYALTYEACGSGDRNCDMKPASVCVQPDNRWLMTDSTPADLDPLIRLLPGEPGKCYRVYRDGEARPLCMKAAGSPNTVWSLR